MSFLLEKGSIFSSLPRLYSVRTSFSVQVPEMWIVYALLAYYIGPRIPGIAAKVWTLLVFLAIPYLISKIWKNYLHLIFQDPLLSLLIVFTALSASWSTSSIVTIEYTRALLYSTFFGTYLAARYSLSEQFKIIFKVLLVFALLNLLVPIVAPSYGVDFSYLGGSVWRGIHRHKNEMSGAMSLGTILFVLALLYKPEYRFKACVGAAVGFLVLVMSGGMGSLGIFVGMLLVVPLTKILRQYYKLKVVVLITFLAILSSVVIFTLINFEYIVVDLLGKDLDFNSRVPLWTLVIELAAGKSWLGFGYGGFWIDSDNAQSVAFAFPWISGVGKGGGNAHNGYIELFLQLGLVGLSAVLIHLTFTLSRVFFLVTSTKKVEYLWMFIFLLFMVATSIYESYGTFLTPKHWYWVLYVSGSYSSIIDLRKRRLALNQFLPLNDHSRKIAIH